MSGCWDPNWPDGVNMNLVRNHILHCRNEINTLCEESGLPLPEFYKRPVPDEVPMGYMVVGGERFQERYERLSPHRRLVLSDEAKPPEQLSLFDFCEATV